MSRPSLVEILREARVGARLFARLPAFLRHPISPEEARRVLRSRLEHRETDFLALVSRAIYAQPASPYRALLALAGCEYGDLERLVRREGVEHALGALYREGVHLTVDEFKGRKPVVRGRSTIAADSDRLGNLGSTPMISLRSSGSRSTGTPVRLDLAFVRDCAIDTCLNLEARGGIAWVKALWESAGGGAAFRLLKLASFGAPPQRWFSQVDVAAPELHPRYRWSARVMRWGGALAGVSLPRPEHVPLEDPLPIARWMADTLRAGQRPFLYTFASSAVRLARAALDAGIDLRGAEFTLMGEPSTEARLAVIRRVGGQPRPRYGSIETGPIGYACLAPHAPDDVHILSDLHAVIQPDGGIAPGPRPSRPLLVTSLRMTAPLVMLNVSMGDQAVMVRRSCGCPLEGLGWTTHLHTIRSFEKLTSEGVTFLDTDVIRVLEEVLPAQFGGAPTDYQLVEHEGEDGRMEILLLVHPALGPLDSGAIAEAFLGAIAPGSGGERVMGLVWRAASVLRVERRVPLVTATGKILHLHVRRSSAAFAGGERPRETR